jgi:TonB family protein
MTLVLLASTTIRVSLVLAVALVTIRLLDRSSASVRRAVLGAAICGALALPLVGLLLPTWHLPRLVASSSRAARTFTAPAHVMADETAVANTAGDAVPANSPPPTPGHTPAWPVGTLLAWLWAAGAIAAGLMLAVGLGQLLSVMRHAEVVTGGPWLAGLNALTRDDTRLARVTLLQSNHPSLLVTWGFLRPTIILPRGAQAWQDSRVRVVLEHEAEHIRRGDWLLQLAAELLRALSWFNPLVWAAADRLRVESERACDDAVLRRGVAAVDYAEHLLALSRVLRTPHIWMPAPAMARPSSLERRVTAMLNPQISRRPITGISRMLLVTPLLALTVSIATFAAQSPFATVTGVVHDPLGGTIPKVTLTLVHAQSGAKHEITSGSDGSFEFVGLPAGNYTLTTKAMGFKLQESPLQLAGGQTARRDVTLPIGTLQETIMVRDRPTATTPTRRRAAVSDPSLACSALPNSGGLTPPKKVLDVRPQYPATMQGSTVGGQVQMKAVIGIDGAVRTVQTTEATNPDFDLAAQEAVKQWRFTPTLLNCVPVEVEMNVSTSFTPE